MDEPARPYAHWINGAPSVAPGANTQLVKVIPSSGRIGMVYGFRITSQEANAAAKTWALRLSLQGNAVTLAEVDVLAPAWPIIDGAEIGILRGNGVDFFEVINLVAGTAATRHQASILYAETEI